MKFTREEKQYIKKAFGKKWKHFVKELSKDEIMDIVSYFLYDQPEGLDTETSTHVLNKIRQNCSMILVLHKAL